MNLKGAAAIVTGGASGLGAATATALAKAGAKVSIVDADRDRAEALARDIGGLAFVCNVADADDTRCAIDEAEAKHGVARLLVHCAGVAPSKKIVGQNGPMDLQDFRRVIDINLVGTFNLLRLTSARMMTLEPFEDGERGLAILTASIAAYEGQIGQTAYAASKAGVVGLVLPAARELAANGIRVCGVAPGVFETPMVSGMSPDVQKSLYANVPFPQRFGRPDEFAQLVISMAGNVMINGEVIRLDGANRMAPR
jgi:NAD(P)-dependent dehydrogenase (short-subunit alcohol dehydrogenase family)